MKIVLVDDERNIVAGLEHILKKRYPDMAVQAFTDPCAALEHMLQSMPDLLITDIKMPEMSGLELISQVQEAGLRFYAVLTGLDDHRLMQDSIRLQVSDYLFKPINKQELFNLVDRVDARLHQMDEQSDRQLAERIALCMQYGLQAATLPEQLPFTALLLTGAETLLPEQAAALLLPPVTICADDQRFSLYLSKKATADELQKELVRTQSDHCVVAPFEKQNLYELFSTVQSTLRDDVSFFLALLAQDDPAAPDADRALRRYLTQSRENPAARMEKLCHALGRSSGCFDLYTMAAAYLMGEKTCDGVLSFLRQLPPVRMPQSKDISIMLDWITQHYQEDISLSQAAAHVFLQANYVSTLFSREMGVSFVKYLNQFRVDQACRMIQQASSASFADVAVQTGFGSLRYFFSTFKRYTGSTPGAFRQTLEQAQLLTDGKP